MLVAELLGCRAPLTLLLAPPAERDAAVRRDPCSETLVGGADVV